MTTVLTVVLALSVTIEPAAVPGQAAGKQAGVILSLPRIEKQTEIPKAAAEGETAAEVSDSQAPNTTDNAETVKPETSGGNDPQENPQSAVTLASRSGLADVTQQPAPAPTPAPAPQASYSEEDLYWMARIISAEAKGESLEGQIAVGAVVMNRIKDSRFPKSVKAVVLAGGQFDPVRNGTIYNTPVPSAVEAAKRVLQGENPVPSALYFYNPDIASDSWIRTLRVITRIGNHVFAASN